jgi:hypothetical protein
MQRRAALVRFRKKKAAGMYMESIIAILKEQLLATSPAAASGAMEMLKHPTLVGQ